jgi:hypothetical protein
MKKLAENRPFYRDRNWLTGFVFSMVVVIGFYYLVMRPARERNSPPPAQVGTAQTGQEGILPGTDQPGAGWQAGITFTAPGSLPSDVLRVGEEVWVFTDEGKKLVRLNLSGEVLAESALEVLCSKAAWDGEAVWCVNTSANVSKIEPATGKELGKFDTGIESMQSIAWDGDNLWVMTQTGSMARYDRSGQQLERKRVGDYGFARDLAWMGEELWVVYIPPQLVRYDAKLSVVERISSACGLTQGVLDYSIDWDGESLWFLDFISARVLQCVPVN